MENAPRWMLPKQARLDSGIPEFGSISANRMFPPILARQYSLLVVQGEPGMRDTCSLTYKPLESMVEDGVQSILAQPHLRRVTSFQAWCQAWLV